MDKSSFGPSLFGKASELKKRLWFTLLALIVYRLGTFIPLPGVDVTALKSFFEGNGGGGNIIGMFDMFTGGALSRMTIFALNIMPYISASIIISLMSSVSKELGNLRKEGESGRQKLNQYTRYLTVLICIVQAYFISVGLESLTNNQGENAVMISAGFFRFSTVVSLLGGTMFVVWLGEQITSRGVGQGSSLIIFTGIIANLPSAIFKTLQMGKTGALAPLTIVFIIVMVLALIALIVFVERAQRRIVIHYPKRQMMMGYSQSENSHMPLKLNTSGVLPPIFASSILSLPILAGRFVSADAPTWLNTILINMQPGQPVYMGVFALMIAFFAFFYTAVVFNPEETAENLKNYGGYISGVRPGKNTAEYLDHVLTRITVFGAFYLVLISLVPNFLITQLNVPFYLGGTTLLIVCNVAMDTVAQIQSHLIANQYENLMKKGNKIKIKRKWR